MSDNPEEPKVVTSFGNYKKRRMHQKSQEALQNKHPQRMLEFRLEDGSKLMVIKSPDTEEFKELDEMLKFRRGLTRNLLTQSLKATDPRITKVVDEDATDFVQSIVYAYGLEHLTPEFLTQVKTHIIGEMFAMFNTEFAGLGNTISNDIGKTNDPVQKEEE